MQQSKGPGAPPNNDNASNRRKGLADGLYVKIFVNAKVNTKFIAKLEQDLGHKPSTEEIRAKLKELSSKAISEYLEN